MENKSLLIGARIRIGDNVGTIVDRTAHGNALVVRFDAREDGRTMMDVIPPESFGSVVVIARAEVPADPARAIADRIAVEAAKAVYGIFALSGARSYEVRSGTGGRASIAVEGGGKLVTVSIDVETL